MYKPQTFRLASTIHWPGAGPTNEIHTDHVTQVKTDGDDYIFHHASGYAVKVPKSSVTSQGFWDADEIPNLPTEDDKKDDKKSKRSIAHKTPIPSADTLGDHSKAGEAKPSDEPFNASKSVQTVDTKASARVSKKHTETSGDNADDGQVRDSAKEKSESSVAGNIKADDAASKDEDDKEVIFGSPKKKSKKTF